MSAKVRNIRGFMHLTRFSYKYPEKIFPVQKIPILRDILHYRKRMVVKYDMPIAYYLFI